MGPHVPYLNQFTFILRGEPPVLLQYKFGTRRVETLKVYDDLYVQKVVQ